MAFVPDPEPAGRFVPDEVVPPPLKSSAMPPIEGIWAEPGEELPTKDEIYPFARTAAQMSVGAPIWLGGSPIAGGAASALAGVGVDILFGRVPDPEQVGTEAVLGMAVPGGAALVGKGARKLSGKAAMGLYESAAKIFPSINLSERNQRIMTALRDRILPVGEKSIDTLAGFTREMDDIVGKGLNQRTVAGDMIPTKGIKDAARNKLASMERSNIFGEAGVPDVIRKKFAELESLPDHISPNKALEYRRTMNKELSGYFSKKQKSGLTSGESSDDAFTAEVRKQINDDIYGLIPELRELGKREAQIINLKQTVERATSRVGNRDVLSIGSLVAAGLGEGLGRADREHQGIYDQAKYGAAGLFVYSILSRPNVKARIAFALARVGGLANASDDTLTLIGLTREAAFKMQPKLRALKAPPTALPGEIPESYVRGIPAEVQKTAYLGEEIPGPMHYAGDPAEIAARESRLSGTSWMSANPEVSQIERAYLGWPYKEPLPMLPPKGATIRPIESLDDYYRKFSVRPQIR